MNTFKRIADHFKPDKQLMEEETTLFAQIMENDEQEQAGLNVPALPRSIYDQHVHKMNILCSRGHVTNDQGGWQS